MAYSSYRLKYWCHEFAWQKIRLRRKVSKFVPLRVQFQNIHSLGHWMDLLWLFCYHFNLLEFSMHDYLRPRRFNKAKTTQLDFGYYFECYWYFLHFWSYCQNNYDGILPTQKLLSKRRLEHNGFRNCPNFFSGNDITCFWSRRYFFQSIQDNESTKTS